MKNLLKIYDIFKTKESLKEVDSLNDISKATKKILTNKKKFRNYFIEYTKKTEVYSFKSPGITHYPLLQKKSSALLPVQRRKMKFFEDLKEEKKEQVKKNDLLLFSKNNKFTIDTSRDSFYKNKMKQNLKISKLLLKNRILNREKVRLLTKKKPRYNSLFLDFFYKWNKDQSEQINSLFDENYKVNDTNNNNLHNYANTTEDFKHIVNSKYSELKYDDNLIFNTNYTPFVNERLDFIILNNVENVETKLESNFKDYNKNEIKLRLESIKVIFKPIRSKFNALNNLSLKESSSKLSTVLYIPLYFAFIFCIKDVDFFKYILLSCITFSEKEKITFDESLLKPALKALFQQKKNEEVESKINARNSGVVDPIAKKNTTTFRRAVSKPGINFRKASIEKKGTTLLSTNSSKIFNMARNSILENFRSNSKKKKREEIIYSNRKKNYYFHYHSDENYQKISQNENQINNRKEINQYNEYIFIWETRDKSYLVNIQMPIIYFNYKNLREEIATFSDKSLFLYMYKNNFINWDFYCLNYLFSLKVFRKVILQNYSLARKNIIPKNKFEENISFLNNTINILNKKAREMSSKTTLNIHNLVLNNSDEKTIINRDSAKIYNMINSNNESYIFFYTDELHQNTLVKIYSYIILIDYDKLNPKIRWKYILDFKFMKILNEITKYEPLETFLPKIIVTNFQNGSLSIDFSTFKEFNIGILGYEKKNLTDNVESNSRNKTSGNITNNTKENEDLFIDIKFPSLKQEKMYKDEDNKILFRKTNSDLNINFLQDLNRYKMDYWSKKILEEIFKKENPSMYSNKNITPNFVDKKNYAKKSVYTNNVSNFSPMSDNKVNKKFAKHISYNYSKFTSKFH